MAKAWKKKKTCLLEAYSVIRDLQGSYDADVEELKYRATWYWEALAKRYQQKHPLKPSPLDRLVAKCWMDPLLQSRNFTYSVVERALHAYIQLKWRSMGGSTAEDWWVLFSPVSLLLCLVLGVELY